MKAKKQVKYKPAAKTEPRVEEAAATELGAFAAKTHLSAILEKVAHGQTFYITKHGKRIAELRPATAEPKKRIAGLLANKGWWMAPDFDAPLDDFKDYI